MNSALAAWFEALECLNSRLLMAAPCEAARSLAAREPAVAPSSAEKVAVSSVITTWTQSLAAEKAVAAACVRM